MGHADQRTSLSNGTDTSRPPARQDRLVLAEERENIPTFRPILVPSHLDGTRGKVTILPRKGHGGRWDMDQRSVKRNGHLSNANPIEKTGPCRSQGGARMGTGLGP
jgi:hypothetical protein